MRPFFAVAAREIQQRTLALAAAAIFGVLALGAPFLPGIEAHDVHPAVLALLILFGHGAALLVGFGLYGEELAARRMGFYFSRPIGGWALSAGKLAGGLVLVVACQVIVVLPSALAYAGVRGALVELVGDWRFEASVVATLVLAAVAGIAARDRSRWLIVDLAGIALAVAIGATLRGLGYTYWNLPPWGGGYPALQSLAGPALAVYGAWLFVIIVVATLAAAVRARGLHRRAHAFLAIALLAAPLFAMAGSAGVWLVRTTVGPSQLQTVTRLAMTDDAGNLRMVTGTSRFLKEEFLLGQGQSTWLELAPRLLRSHLPMAISGRGDKAVWLDAKTYHFDPWSEPSVAIAQFDFHSGAFRESPVDVISPWCATGLSPEGRWFVFGQGGSVVFYDLSSGASHRVRLPRLDGNRAYGQKVAFLDRGRVRIFATYPRVTMQIFEVDTSEGQPDQAPLISLGVTESHHDRRWGWIEVSPSGDRVASLPVPRAGTFSGQTPSLPLEIYDGMNAALLYAIDVHRAVLGFGVWFLTNGDLVIADASEGATRFRRVDRSGRTVAEMIAPGFDVHVGGEIDPGRLLVSLKRQIDGYEPRDAWLIDLNAGRATRAADGMDALFRDDPLVPAPLPTGPAATLMHHDGKIVRVDVDHGTTTVVFPPPR